jgi:hypothetical protein
VTILDIIVNKMDTPSPAPPTREGEISIESVSPALDGRGSGRVNSLFAIMSITLVDNFTPGKISPVIQ